MDLDPQAVIRQAEQTLERAVIAAETREMVQQAPALRAYIESCAISTAQAIEAGLLSPQTMERIRDALAFHDAPEDSDDDSHC